MQECSTSKNAAKPLSQHYLARRQASLKTQKAISKLEWAVLLHPPLAQILFPQILTTLEPSKMPFVGKGLGVMRFGSDEVWEWWGLGVMRFGSDEVWQWWGLGVVRFESDEVWEWWGLGVMRFGSVEVWEWWGLGVMRFGSGEVWEWWGLGVVRFGSDVVWEWWGYWRSEEVAVSTKFKMVQEVDKLSPAGARLLKLMETAYRNTVCMCYIHHITRVKSKDYTINC